MDKKNHQIIVMDGSDEEVLISMVKGIYSLVIGYLPVVDTTILDLDHPTTIVIDMLVDDETWDAVQMRFEDLYPGLCIFDPPMLAR